ncbi:MAG: hypothetical protein NTZ04_07260, partial [Chloroflexi bacterium]|nr:hypothetical protein [Chloroflexota bacterium]
QGRWGWTCDKVNHKRGDNVMKKVLLPIALLVLLLFAFVLVGPKTMPVAAAIALRGPATTATTTGTSLTIAKPTGVVAGDVLLVNIAQVGNDTTNPTLSGWTVVAGADLGGTITHRRGAVLYKVAGASEPTSYIFALGTGTDGAVGSIVAFSGVDTSGATPFDVAPGTILVSGSSTTAVAATTITTASANAVVIMFGMADKGDPTYSGWTTTSPGALTELYDNQLTTTASVGAAWATKGTAGGTGAGAATLSSSERNGGILIALKPGDTTVPTLTAVHIASNNATPSLAKVGDNVTLTFTSSQSLQTPTVTIAGHAAAVSGSGTSWSATYMMASGDSEGVVAFSIAFKEHELECHLHDGLR